MKNKKLRLLQVFRGLAAILVVCYHTGTLFAKNLNTLAFNNSFKFGHTGVTFFFVLSGFIIYYIHYKDIGDRSRFLPFLRKRFVRVYPIYWVVIFLKLVLFKKIPLLFLIQSILLVPMASAPFLSVSWTLSYEVFFYLLFGALILYSTRTTIAISLIYVLTIVIALLTNNFGLGQNTSSYFNFLFSPSILQFCLGILAAHLVRFQPQIGGNGFFLLWSGVLLYTCFSVLTVLSINSSAQGALVSPYQQAELMDTVFERYSVLFFAIPSAMIIWGAALIDLKKDIKIPRLFIFLGDASYSIYLVHAIIVNSVTLKLKSMIGIGVSSNLYVIPVIIFAIGCGCIFHLIIERPMMQYLNRISAKKVAV